MTTEDLDAIEVGHTVKVYGGSRRPDDGVIVKIGPKLVHIEMWRTVTTFYRSNRQRRDGHPGSFQTLAREADGDRRRTADGRLRVYGIDVGWRSDVLWTTARREALIEAIAAILADGGAA